MSITTTTKKVIIVGIVNSMIEDEKITLLVNIKITHSNICQYHHFRISNILTPELTKL